MNPDTTRSAIRVAAVTTLVLLVPAVAMLAGDEGTDWGVMDFVAAAVLLAGAGALLELAVRHPGNLALRVGGGLLGVAAIALGEADDAPGLVGFGCLVILATAALSVRAVRRSA